MEILKRRSSFLEVAKKQGAEYSPTEDSPQRIEQSISDLQLLAGSKEDSPVWRQGYTKFLVSQATALANWGDLDTAERTANEAAAVGNGLEIQGITPSDVLQLIAQLRTKDTSPIAALETPKPSADAKTETLVLLADARKALNSGNIRMAEALAVQASQLGVADTQFAPEEDRPSKIVADIQRARDEMQQVILASENAPAELALPPAGGNTLSPRMAQLPAALPTSIACSH